MDRRCQTCEGIASVKERYSVLLVPWVYRYRCHDCGTKMDLYSRPGAFGMALLAVGLPVLVALLPAAKFRRESDRWWILMLLLAQGVVVLVLVVRGKRRSRDNPLIGGK